ncbi:MAG: rhomboid family intramembrane serine protease [Bacteroidota bacterium]|nr:rhomboid family intramembrane serine protease [Bacteroidota bacterium]
MIPIGDDRLHNAATPVFTWVLILINVLAFLYELSLGAHVESFIALYGATPAQILSGNNIQSIFTSLFLHGGWMHLIGNMLFLWVFGDNIEAVLGRMRFILFYLAGGVVATFAHIYFNQASNVPSIGASGAISACLGAYLVMFPRSRVRVLIPLIIIFTTIRLSAFAFLGLWIGLQVVNTYIESSAGKLPEDGGVAWWAHIGGFAFGLLIGLIFQGKARELVVIQDDWHRRRRGYWQ